MVNHPTTTSQTTTSHNKGQTLYMTYSDGDSVPNGDMDDESGNTQPWQAVVKKRKRNPQSNLIENPVPSTTHNRYEPLKENTLDETSTDTSTSTPNISVKPPLNPRPPPIYIYGVTNYKAMLRSLQKAIEEERFYTKTLSNNTVKINTHSTEGYRSLIGHLQDENIVQYTIPISSRKKGRTDCYSGSTSLHSH